MDMAIPHTETYLDLYNQSTYASVLLSFVFFSVDDIVCDAFTECEEYSILSTIFQLLTVN